MSVSWLVGYWNYHVGYGCSGWMALAVSREDHSSPSVWIQGRLEVFVRDWNLVLWGEMGRSETDVLRIVSL